MLVSDLIAQVRSELQEASPGYWSNDELLSWLNLAEADYINRTRLLEDKATMTTVAGRVDYPLPSNWMSTKMVWYHKPDEGGVDHQWMLMPTNLEKMAEETQDPLTTSTTKRDDPSAFWIWGKTLNLKPPPKDDGHTVTMLYESKPIPLTQLTDSLNVDDSLADGPRNYVLWHAWLKEGETDRAMQAKAEYESCVRDGLRYKKKQMGNLARSIDIRTSKPLQGTSRSVGSNPFYYNP